MVRAAALKAIDLMGPPPAPTSIAIRMMAVMLGFRREVRYGSLVCKMRGHLPRHLRPQRGRIRCDAGNPSAAADGRAAAARAAGAASRDHARLHGTTARGVRSAADRR